MELTHIAVDTSKYVFTLHGIAATGRTVLRRDVKRAAFLPFLSKLAPLTVSLEACGGSHHWGRAIAAMGHTVQLVPAQYVKPFVKRGKNDRADAQAISEAAARPDIHFVPVKSVATQAQTMLLKLRACFVRQRTQLINEVRGFAAEFGLVSPRGTVHLPEVLAAIEAAELPEAAGAAFQQLAGAVARLDEQIAGLDARIQAAHRANPVSRALAAIPGVGPITAMHVALAVDPRQFASGRHFAAWLGLAPKDRSTGGKQRLGVISRAGNETLRSLLVVGATAVVAAAIRHPDSRCNSPWLQQLLARKPRKLAAVALANKTARIIWAMMSRGEAYRGATPAHA